MVAEEQQQQREEGAASYRSGVLPGEGGTGVKQEQSSRRASGRAG